MAGLQLLRRTQSEIAASSAVLDAGRPLVELDDTTGLSTGRITYGDGVTPMNALPFAAGGTGLPTGGTDGQALVKSGASGTWSTLTKSSVGLGSVDNTADAAKPISTAQAAVNSSLLTAIGSKADNAATTAALATKAAQADLDDTNAAVTAVNATLPDLAPQTAIDDLDARVTTVETGKADADTTTAALAGKVGKSANLSDLASATTSRANLGVPLVTDAPTPTSVATKRHADLASLRNHPALRLFHSHMNVHDSFNETGIDPVGRVVITGDSFIDIGTNVSKRERTWWEMLTQYLARNKQGYGYYQTTSAGAFNSFTASAFPGGTNPWTISGGTAGAGGAYGLGMHSISVPAGATLSTTYHGDIANILYVGNTGSATSVTVTLDGVAGTPITDANVAGPVGKVTNAGTIGDHGWHTLTFAPTGGPFLISGISPLDGIKLGLGIPWDGVIVSSAGKAGFAVANYIDPAQLWDLHLAIQNPDLMIWSLGSNDVASVSAATFQTQLQSLFSRVDTTLGTTKVGHVLMAWPNIANVTGSVSPGPDYVQAMYAAAQAFDPARVCVVPVEQFISWPTWQAQTPNDDTHPGDMLNASIAALLAEILAPGAHIRTPGDRGPVRIQAVDDVRSRSSWPESLAQADSTSSTVLDSTATNDATVRRRRHRVWLEAGTWQCISQFQSGAAKGIANVSINGTSLGNVDCYVASGSAIKVTTHGTTFVAPAAGFYYVEIQATGTKNASATSTVISFAELLLRRS